MKFSIVNICAVFILITQCGQSQGVVEDLKYFPWFPQPKPTPAPPPCGKNEDMVRVACDRKCVYNDGIMEECHSLCVCKQGYVRVYPDKCTRERDVKCPKVPTATYKPAKPKPTLPPGRPGHTIPVTEDQNDIPPATTTIAPLLSKTKRPHNVRS